MKGRIISYLSEFKDNFKGNSNLEFTGCIVGERDVLTLFSNCILLCVTRPTYAYRNIIGFLTLPGVADYHDNIIIVDIIFSCSR